MKTHLLSRRGIKLVPDNLTKRNDSGFTLIELMITIAIIGILAAIAFSSFTSYDCLAKQSEARSNLGAIATSEDAYFCEYDIYGTLASIGFAVKGEARYGYSVQVNGLSTFLATAAGVLSGKNDAWTMDQTYQMTHTVNACQ